MTTTTTDPAIIPAVLHLAADMLATAAPPDPDRRLSEATCVTRAVTAAVEELVGGPVREALHLDNWEPETRGEGIRVMHDTAAAVARGAA